MNGRVIELQIIYFCNIRRFEVSQFHFYSFIQEMVVTKSGAFLGKCTITSTNVIMEVPWDLNRIHQHDSPIDLIVASLL